MDAPSYGLLRKVYPYKSSSHHSPINSNLWKFYPFARGSIPPIRDSLFSSYWISRRTLIGYVIHKGEPTIGCWAITSTSFQCADAEWRRIDILGPGHRSIVYKVWSKIEVVDWRLHVYTTWYVEIIGEKTDCSALDVGCFKLECDTSTMNDESWKRYERDEGIRRKRIKKPAWLLMVKFIYNLFPRDSRTTVLRGQKALGTRLVHLYNANG